MVPPNSTDDINKLLEIASRQPAPKKKKTYPEIDLFIKELNIVPGTKRIPTSIIYFHYYLWKLKNEGNIDRLISRRILIKQFDIKFKKVKTDHGIGYLLNPKPFDLSPQSFFKARALLRKERDEKKEKTTKA